jgi:GNAT superfamily N-acetyltransferase
MIALGHLPEIGVVVLESSINEIPCTEDGKIDYEVFVIHARGENGTKLGRLRYSTGTGECYSLFVEPEFRRLGVATLMWDSSVVLTGVDPLHSGFRTDDGDAWASSRAEVLPEREQA